MELNSNKKFKEVESKNGVLRFQESKSLNKLAKYSVILSIIPALYFAFFPGKIVLISIICSYPLLIGILLSSKKHLNKNFEGVFYIKIFIIYNIIVLLRGLIDASSMQDWTVMFASTIPLFLITHFSIYLATYKSSVIVFIRSFLIYGLSLSMLFFFTDEFGFIEFPHVVSPIYFMILLIPYMGKKFGILIFILALISFISDFSNRSNLINILIASIIMVSFLWKKKIWMLKLVKYIRTILLTLPVLFIILGVTGIFNIFLIGNLLGEFMIDFGKDQSQDLLVDSRTSIYTDVFSQLTNDNAIVFGLGASGKTKTSLTDISYADFDLIYKEGRRNTESGMLNYIQWGGLVGGLVYFLLFVKASYYGIYKSKNWFCIMLGLWIAFRGFYSFIEDFMLFSINSLFILVSVGICLSKKFRLMNDLELKFMFRRMLNMKIS
jgi:hypothetical protein